MPRKNPYYTKTYSDGNKVWYLNDKRHRVDGPAIENSNGYKVWCLNDQRHRVDGPAVEYNNGDKRWYLNGIRYTEQEYNNKISEITRFLCLPK